jgi:hypothetical protein
MVLYAWNTTARPDFIAATAPNFRYAREVWMAVGPGDAYAHGDERAAQELRRVYDKFQASALMNIRLPGILGHLQAALPEFGWELHTATIFLTQDNLELDLKLNPPAEVQASLVTVFEAKLDRVHQTRHPPETPWFDWPRLRRFLRSHCSHWRPAYKSVLLQLFAGHIPTRSWAHALVLMMVV